MPVEMIDFGKFAQTAIAFQNLNETIRRNDLGAQGLTLEQGRLQAQREALRIDQQRVNYQQGVKVLDELDKIEAEPGFQFNPRQRAQFLVTRGTILRNISGLKDLPIPESVDDAIGAGNAYTALYKSIQSDDPKVRQAGMDQWAAENPKQFLLAAKTAKAEMELGEGFEQRRLLTQISAEKLDALKQKNAAYTIIDNVYGVNVAEMRAPLNVLQKPEMAAHFKKLQGMTDQARDAYMAMYPEVANELSTLRMGYEDRSRTRVGQLSQDFEARRQALEQAQTDSPNGQAAQQYVDEYQAHKLAVKARTAEHDWLSTRDNFFDPEKYKAVLRAEQDLRVAQGKPKAVLNGIQEERLAFQGLLRDDKNREADLKHKTGLAQALLQEEYSKARVANPSENENQSVASAITAVRKEFPGVPFDPSKLEDLSKKGQQTVTILSPGERTNIAEERSLVGQLDKLIKTYDPAYVGAIDSRVGTVGQLTGTLSAKREMWLQEGRAFLSEARHKIFGASLTVGEQEAALNELPNESMGDKQWPAAAKAWKDKWGRLIEERLKIANQSRATVVLPANQGRPPVALPQGYVDQQSLKQELLNDYK